MESDQTNQNFVTSRPGEDIVFRDNGKRSRGMVIGMICLAILAVGGVGFGVWAMMDKNQGSDAESMSEKTDSSTDEEANVLDNQNNMINVELAENLVNPYLESFTYGTNLLDTGLNEESKASVAFFNLGYDYVGSGIVFYDLLNEKYQYLFGNDESLEKKNYEVGYHKLIFTNDTFKIESGGGGGTGIYSINAVKDVTKEGENITVEVYHDNISVCGAESSNDDYCMTEEEYTNPRVTDLVNKRKDKLPVYSMGFVKEGDHYILTSVSKM